MSLPLPRAEGAIALHEPLTLENRVSFDIALGKYATAKNLTYDVDYPLLSDALQQGGMDNQDIANTAITIKRSSNPARGGLGGTEDGVPQIELYTYRGRGAVSTRSAAHEACHVADAVHVGESAFIPAATRRWRKAAVVAGATVLGVGYMHFLAHSGLPKTAFETDVLTSASLMGEYMIRPEERRARQAGRSVIDQNLLVVTNANGERVKPSRIDIVATAIGSLRGAFIPDFTL